ncbi:MAG: sigma 54-interacting transcriptional regulator [Treponema sp.]|jgi:Nif-specific regulatory protein|nr:sigma 54-interacting transcriptional regulator [Treponema sp.]
MLSTIDVQKFNTLVEIGNLINSNYSDVHALLSHILESVTCFCGGDASGILLLDREKQELYIEADRGIKRRGVKPYTMKTGEGIAGWVLQHNKPLIINDVDSDKRYQKRIAQEFNYPLTNMIAVPLRLKDECTGVIEILNKADGKSFGEDDIEWVEIFAAQAAIAITSVRDIEQAREKARLLRDPVKTDREYHTMIAKSPLILEKLEIIDRVAKTDSSVLILGESGVGKELFAEQIHLRSPRSRAPFVRVNCAAIPEGLLESELFGHVKGAFTNAIANRQGRFEMADRGTIFLDEIADIPLALQAKLLRVIQERTFEKVGSDVSTTVNVRILAATNKDIEAQVEKGQFRSDLYYRLNVLPLYIPPLRQRPDDIPELASFFLKKFTAETKKQFEGFSEKAMETMLSYSWPGNVRELENCVERACVIGKNGWIQREDLFLNSRIEISEGGEGERNLKNAINSFKAQFIRGVLEENNWNQTEAARDLDIQRTYLSRLIKEFDIVNLKSGVNNK